MLSFFPLSPPPSRPVPSLSRPSPESPSQASGAAFNSTSTCCTDLCTSTYATESLTTTNGNTALLDAAKGNSTTKRRSTTRYPPFRLCSCVYFLSVEQQHTHPPAHVAHVELTFDQYKSGLNSTVNIIIAAGSILLSKAPPNYHLPGAVVSTPQTGAISRTAATNTFLLYRRGRSRHGSLPPRRPLREGASGPFLR